MYEVAEAIQTTIRNYVLNPQPLVEAVAPGDMSIKVASIRHYPRGVQLAIFDGNTYEFHTVVDYGCTDLNTTACDTLILNEPILQTYTQSKRNDNGQFIEAKVQKVHEGKFIQDIIIGDPDVVQTTPAILIDYDTQENTPLTLGPTQSEDYPFTITVLIEDSDYDNAYRAIRKLSGRVAMALNMTLLPLVKPYFSTPLVKDAPDGSATITVLDGSFWGDWWLESLVYLKTWSDVYEYKLVEKVSDDSGGAVFRLAYPISAERNFWTGDELIIPTHRVYKTFVNGIAYPKITIGDRNFRAGVIDYTATIAKHRFQPLGD